MNVCGRHPGPLDEFLSHNSRSRGFRWPLHSDLDEAALLSEWSGFQPLRLLRARRRGRRRSDPALHRDTDIGAAWKLFSGALEGQVILGWRICFFRGRSFYDLISQEV